VLLEEKLVERSAKLGPWFMEELKAIKSKHIVEVRGKGLWIGMVLDTKARPFCEALKAEGLLCKETHETVIRFAPPLVIAKKDLNLALRRIKKVFAKMEK
jgi:ornithine--oxo-acid transaminase